MTPDRVLGLGLAFWGSKTLLSAVEMGVFTELAKGPLPESELRARLRLHARSSHDFLDALVALGMLERRGEQYANTAETDLFLDRAKPSYVGGMLEMANERLYPFWGRLTTALRTGEPQNEIRAGDNFFARLYAQPERLQGFLQAMTSLSRGAAMAIAERFPWERYATFADVGGAEGGVAAVIASRHPRLTGIVFDLPPVEPHFRRHSEAQGVANRVRFQAGDFFADPLPRVDVIILGHILHDWGLDEKRALVRKAYDALPSGGSLIVHEALIDDERRANSFGLLMSLNMLIETPAGSDFTGAQCSEWMREAGFRETRVEPLAGPDGMVVGVK